MVFSCDAIIIRDRTPGISFKFTVLKQAPSHLSLLLPRIIIIANYYLLCFETDIFHTHFPHTCDLSCLALYHEVKDVTPPEIVRRQDIETVFTSTLYVLVLVMVFCCVALVFSLESNPTDIRE